VGALRTRACGTEGVNCRQSSLGRAPCNRMGPACDCGRDPGLLHAHACRGRLASHICARIEAGRQHSRAPPEMGDGGAGGADCILPSSTPPLRMLRSFTICQESQASSDLKRTGCGPGSARGRAGRGEFLTNPSLSSLAAVERSQRPPRVESPAKECARPSVVTGGCSQSIGALDLAAVRSLTWASSGPYGNSCWGRGRWIRAAVKHGDSRGH